MAKRIFLDVGGHLGQSVEVALAREWIFDHIHTFEPEPASARHIEMRFADAIRDGRLTVHQAALGSKDGTITLFGDNSKGGASVVDGALQGAGAGVNVASIDVNRFLKELGPDTQIFIKLNCEGGEVDILDRLCEAGSVSNIAAIVADFDVVKRGFGYYEKRRVLRQARRKGLPIVLSEQVMVGKTHALRLANWLSSCPEIAAPGTALQTRPQLFKRRFRYFIRDMRSAVGVSAPGYRR